MKVKILWFILSALLGGIFIFSGYAKLYPIEPFEYTFVELGMHWYLAPFVSRLLIGVEFFIGAMFILNIAIERIAKLAIGVLLVFSIYLTLIILVSGNTGNCGCFGEYLPMTPLQGIIKNIFLLGFSILLMRFHKGFEFKGIKYLIWAVVIAAIAIPHILNYVEIGYSELYLQKPEGYYNLQMDTLYHNAKEHSPPEELRKGKHIITFLSMTCPHCRIAAQKISLMKKMNPALPFYFVLNGSPDSIQSFLDKTNNETMNYCLLDGKPFMMLTGMSIPKVYLVNNSVVEADLTHLTLDQPLVEKWLEKP